MSLTLSISNFLEEPEFQDAFEKKYFLHSRVFKNREEKSLMPWEVINGFLSEHRLQFPRIRLWRNGELLSESLYTLKDPLRRYELLRIDPEKFNKEIQKGASIVLGSVDEIHEPLERVTLKFEEMFGENFMVNSYISWREVPAFNPHWDDHDVFIFQVHGKKKWFVSPDTWKYPMPEDYSGSLTPPKKSWQEVILKSGEFLFIPRGWWHYAQALNEPSLHLTFGMLNRTGSHLIQWIAKKSCQEEFFRKDIPRYNKEKLSIYMKAFKSQLFSLIQNETFVEEYLEGLYIQRRLRPKFSLPEVGIEKFNFLGKPDCKVELSTIILDDYRTDYDNCKLTFRSNKKFWEFPLFYQQVIDLLRNNPQGITVANIHTQLSQSLTSDKLNNALLELLEKGIIKVSAL